MHVLRPIDSLRAEILATVADASPEELPERLVELVEQQTAPLRDEVAQRGREATTAHTDARRLANLLAQSEGLAAHQHGVIVRAATAAGHAGELIRRVRKLCQGSFDGKIVAEDVLAILAEEVHQPELRELPVGFWPREQYRGGVFMSADGAIRVTYTFCGWMNVASSATGPIAPQPAFLLPDTGGVQAQRAIEVERGLLLQYPLLPPLRAAA